jgi:hypothetical protein
MVALGAYSRIGVRFLAHQLHVLPLFFHQPHELLRTKFGALVVVGDDLGYGDTLGIDLPVYEE